MRHSAYSSYESWLGMRHYLKVFFALNASLAYLGMLTGFGMLFFASLFFYLLLSDVGLPAPLHWSLTYLMFVLGPGAILLATIFYHKIRRQF